MNRIKEKEFEYREEKNIQMEVLEMLLARGK